MQRPRLIPVLLLRNNGLVKSTAFRNFNYIGDPINAVRIFNDSRADELFFLDISATRENRLIPLDFVRAVGEEAQMPFAVGGGINKLEHIQDLINAGAERVVINTKAGTDASFIRNAANHFGSSTIVVCIDVRKDFWGREKVWIRNGSKPIDLSPENFAQLMEDAGAGELVIQSIARDGKMTGYDIDLVKRISMTVSIPVVALGGAGRISHLQELYDQTFVNGLAAGSIFVYQGSEKGVLINYPTKPVINLS